MDADDAIADCGTLTDELCSVGAAPESVTCENCGSTNTKRVIGRSAYLTSDAQKTSRLDPRYDKQVDQAMRNTRNADPDRYLGHLKNKPPAKKS